MIMINWIEYWTTYKITDDDSLFTLLKRLKRILFELGQQGTVQCHPHLIHEGSLDKSHAWHHKPAITRFTGLSMNAAATKNYTKCSNYLK